MDKAVASKERIAQWEAYLRVLAAAHQIIAEKYRQTAMALELERSQAQLERGEILE